MVKFGMTPEQALRSATVAGAELLGWTDKLGNHRPCDRCTKALAQDEEERTQ